MSMTLSIPIKQQITLPDAWQACRTPQELSYWLIAKFETFEAVVDAAATAAAEASHEAQTALAAAQAAATDATRALNAISNLDAQVVQLNARVTSLSADLTAAEGNITALTARMATAETDIDGLESRVGQAEFDIGQAQTDINAVGTIAQNNQREIGTDETAGTIKGRIRRLDTQINGSGGLADDVNELQNQHLQAAIGGTLRQLLATINVNINFANTAWINLGSLAWAYNPTAKRFQATFSAMKSTTNADVNILCSAYAYTSDIYYHDDGADIIVSKGICTSLDKILVRDDSYTDAATFKAAMSGVIIAYEKAATT